MAAILTYELRHKPAHQKSASVQPAEDAGPFCMRGHCLPLEAQSWSDAASDCPTCIAEECLIQLHIKAAGLGLACLEATWQGKNAFHRFRCSAGHEWTQPPERLLCPACAAAKATPRTAVGLERLRRIAEDKGGHCLSAAYLGSARYHLFQCAEGHEWMRSATAVLNGGWCDQCEGEREQRRRFPPDGLQRLQAVAEARGGMCLSTTYLGVDEHYRFRCAQGHEWDAKGEAMLARSWCRQCFAESRRLGLGTAQACAEARGGHCLSSSYRNSKTPLDWVCAQGHFWRAPLRDLRRGRWCTKCPPHTDSASPSPPCEPAPCKDCVVRPTDRHAALAQPVPSGTSTPRR